MCIVGRKNTMPSITPDFIAKFRQDKEAHWSNCRINRGLYGFQFQAGTKWLPGLSGPQVDEYQERVGFRFPDDLRLLLSQINGTDLPTLNVYGYCGEPHRNGLGVYSYPRDIDHVMLRIQDVTPDREAIAEVLRTDGLDLPDDAGLLPFYSHRYVVCGLDRASSPVLSVHGTDAIVYGEDLRQYLLAEFTQSGQQAD
jgi:hypothetical protein